MKNKEEECPCYTSEEGCDLNCPCHKPFMSGVCYNCEGIKSLEQIYIAMKHCDARMRKEEEVKTP